MDEPTKDYHETPVVNKQGHVREIRFRKGKPGLWTLYLGWQDNVNWTNWEPLDREPLTGMREWYKLVGGAGGLK